MAIPPISSGLPVEDVVPEVAAALESAGHVVLVAPPGSGKTTIVPLRLMGAPWLASGKIVVLEPRRLATRAAARRMAALMGEDVGGTVGYVTRDDRCTGPGTVIEVVTEGVLTRRIQSDPSLPGTALVVFDELHERNLQTDLGLALVLDVRTALRPDLRVMAMSATIDADRIAALLGGQAGPAPIVMTAAPTHPVDVRWAPPPRNVRLDGHAAATVRRALGSDDGDVLVFLPGMGDIIRVRDRLSDDGVTADVRMLHGSLPTADQDAALAPAPPGTRKVVLSTDIAESSLTVEGISVVIDSGLARAPRFDPRTGMTRLQTVSISKASADQRAGRAGRLGPGVAYRLWSKVEHGGRRRHIEPEITQVDLAGLALELAAWGEPDTLSWLDPPPRRAFGEARDLLSGLGAIDEDGRITAVGRAMATLPLHPRLAHMVVAAGDDAWLACLLAALVEDRDILRGPPNEVPVDLGLRVQIVTGERDHPLAGRGVVARARRDAEDLARRARVVPSTVRVERAGALLALAFPDRLAMRRGSPGRFQLRTGTTAWCPESDPLAVEAFLVGADMDGKRKDARIRLAAAIDPSDVATLFAAEVIEQTTLTWQGDRLVARTERRLGGVALNLTDDRPAPGPDTTAALLSRLRSRDLADLPWSDAAHGVVHRVAFLHRTIGDPWPDWSPDTLAATLEEWLVGAIPEATGLDDFAGIDLGRILRKRLGRLAPDLDRLAPTHLELARGRRVALDYSGEVPILAAKVQDLYGTTKTPEIAGVPVLVHLLSPAGRPVQVTRDLAGFWTGSWHEVRKDMAGRYPKHDWPEDPTG